MNRGSRSPAHPCTLVVVVILALALFAACSDDATPADDAAPAEDLAGEAGGDDAGAEADVGPEADSGTADANGGADTAVPCVGCAGTDGCLNVTVTRAEDTSMQPWVLWPDEADGSGTLIVSAEDPAGTGVDRTTLSGADFTDPAATYAVLLSCVPSGAVEVRAFLDDDGDAAPDAITSADYLDSCMAAPRKKDVTVTAGETLSVEVALANSCD